MKILYTLLFICLVAIGVQAQNDTIVENDTTIELKKENFFQRIGSDGKLTLKTIGYTYSRPFHWKKRDWLRFGGAIAAGGLLTLVDQQISEAFIDRKYKTKGLDALADAGDFMGQPENNYPFMFAVWGTGVIFNHDWLRDTGIMLFASVTTSGILQTLGKTGFGRARPEMNLGAQHFEPFSPEPGLHSLPSGHTMLALATAWVMARQIKFKPLKYAFYAVPVVVGWSRVYHRAHFPSDVLLGSALGIACAESVIRIYPKYKKQLREDKGFAMMPMGNGMRLTYRF